MRTLQSLGLTVSVAVLLAACHTTPTTPEKSVAPQTSVEQPQPVKPDSRTVATVQAPATDPLDDPKGVLSQRSVYFDFDSYTVKPDYNQLVTAHSSYLESHKTRKIIIQGNTDERGGSEYNLALGQKRAEAVRKAMTALGASEGQIEAVSFGKEKPQATGDDESDWAKNRRADIVYGGAK